MMKSKQLQKKHWNQLIKRINKRKIFMFKLNYKYLIYFSSLITILFAEDLIIEKESVGIYTAIFEKEFKVDGQLDMSLINYNGNIVINGINSNDIIIKESCSFKTYSQKDAKLKYYKSKVGFILNENKLEITDAKRNEKINSILEISIPDYTDIKIEDYDSDIIISHLDGNFNLISKRCNIELNNTSSKVKIKGKDNDLNIVNCSIIGDLFLSRGTVNISGLKSEYLNATLYGADLVVDEIDSKVVFKVTGGDIFIKESQNDAKLFTSGGDILVENLFGNIACDTKGGSIDLGEISGMCKIDCITGEISIDEVQGDLNIKAENSEIDVNQAFGSVSIQNSYKDIEIHKISLDNDYKLLVKNKKGDIHLYLESEVQANITAKIEYKDSNFEDYNIESEFHLTNLKNEKKGNLGYLIHSGEINGGGSTIILKTLNGDINIEKE